MRLYPFEYFLLMSVIMHNVHKDHSLSQSPSNALSKLNANKNKNQNSVIISVLNRYIYDIHTFIQKYSSIHFSQNNLH